MKELIKKLLCHHKWIELGATKHSNCECKRLCECEKCKKIKYTSIYEIHQVV